MHPIVGKGFYGVLLQVPSAFRWWNPNSGVLGLKSISDVLSGEFDLAINQLVSPPLFSRSAHFFPPAERLFRIVN